ncbi:hypothetical protein ACVWZW_008408 [Bradyrhizobium sp. F1.13.4]
MRIRGNRARSFWTGTMLILGLLAAPDVASAADAPVGDQAPMQATDLDLSPVGTIVPAKTRFLSLGVGKSAVIDLPRDVKDVLVADPKIANAVIRSAQRAYIIGGQVGPDQRRVLRRRRPAGGRLRHRGEARSQRHAHGTASGAAGRADRRRRRQRDADRLGVEPGRGPAGRRRRRETGRRLRQGGQQHRRARPRPGDAQGRGRRSAPRYRQAVGRRSQRQPERRHRGGELQQFQPVLGQRRTDRQQQRIRCRRPHQGVRDRQRHDARDGKCRCPCARSPSRA